MAVATNEVDAAVGIGQGGSDKVGRERGLGERRRRLGSVVTDWVSTDVEW